MAEARWPPGPEAGPEVTLRCGNELRHGLPAPPALQTARGEVPGAQPDQNAKEKPPSAKSIAVESPAVITSVWAIAGGTRLRTKSRALAILPW